MSEASKALAEVRGWLCENLDASDAGHICGMLSVVSRRVVQADELESENAKLRDELAKARDPQRIGGQADPSSFVYAIEQLREFRWQHATNDEDAIPYINNVAAAHERENAKLRELVRWMYDRMDESCAVQYPYAPAPISYDRLMQALARARELGVEVDG